MKEDVALRAEDSLYVYVTLTFIALIWNFRCNLHTIGNHCQIWTPSVKKKIKNKTGVLVSKRWQVLGIRDLDLLLKDLHM